MNLQKTQGVNQHVIKQFAFTYTKPKVRTIILAEIFDYNICILSFYTDGTGSEKTKYKLRFKYSGAHVLHIFKACLYVFDIIKGENNYALFYNASNDLNDYQEDNKRNAAYGNFFEKYLPNHNNYESLGSLKLNIQAYYPKDHLFKSEVMKFYENYKVKVMKILIKKKMQNNARLILCSGSVINSYFFRSKK